MGSQEFKYFAFISYSGKNEKWAKWLHTKLEHYHIPATLCKENPNIPKKIRPVFWYKKDLSGTKLKEALEKELEVSQYLIVICSPDSAKSDWVNDEVKSFIAKGRSKYIIPFIVDGVPHSVNENDECFPESLRNLPREEEIRGISVQEDGKQHALVDVVATMFNVSFDTLWLRHKRRERNIRNLCIVICTFMMICAFGVWDYTRTKVEYYADYVDCWGIPHGVIALNKNQISNRYRSYKFVYKRISLGQPNAYSWRLNKVVYVNSADIPQEHTTSAYTDRYSIQQFEYSRSTGALISINYALPSGRIILRHNISEHNECRAAVADLLSANQEKGSTFVGSNTTSSLIGLTDISQKKSKIKRFAYHRNAKGQIIRVTFHSSNDDDLFNSIISDGDGIYGMEFELDSLGRRVKVRYLNVDGTYICNKIGIAGKNYQYNSFGSISKLSYFDVHNNLIVNEFLCAEEYIITDKNGNEIEVNYKGADGKPCYNKEGYAKMTTKFNNEGNPIERSCFDKDGKPCYCKDGYAKLTIKYDKSGNPTEYSFYDTGGNRVIVKTDMLSAP